MIKEIENLKIKADKLGIQAAAIHDMLMEDITLPFTKRYELEINMYNLRLEQSKLNLEYQQVISWVMGQKKIKRSF